MRSMSDAHVGFEALAGQLATRVEMRGTLLSRALAKKGFELAHTFRSWCAEPPSDEERRATIESMCDWNRCALEFLSGSR
jgi:hypothetical protein